MAHIHLAARPAAAALSVLAAAVLFTGSAAIRRPGGAAEAATSSGLLIAHGLIRRPDGTPATSGTVTAVALRWQPKIGQITSPLGQAGIAPDGSYTIRTPATKLSAAVSHSGIRGFVDVELRASSGDSVVFWDTPVEVSGGSSATTRHDLELGVGQAPSPATSGPTLFAAAVASAASTRTAATTATSTADYVTRCTQDYYGDFQWRKPKDMKTTVHWLPIEMMVTRGKAKATVTYHKASSSTFGVVVVESGRGMTAGTSHTTNTDQSYEAGAYQSESATRSARADVRYWRLQGYCQSWLDGSLGRWMDVYKWMPGNWRGGVGKDSGTAWTCDKRHSTKAGFVAVQRGTSVTFSGFVGIAGADVNSSVTAIRGVGLRLDSKPGVSQFPFCGYQADPANSFLIREDS